MPTIPIRISFQNPDPTGKHHLEYARYDNLIRYSPKVESSRVFLQLEPAFQFVEGDRDCATYDFDLTIPDGYEFTPDPAANGAPLWSEANSDTRGWLADPVKSVRLFPPNRCQVQVTPQVWAAPNVVTLRFYCSAAGGTALTTYGVSLTLVKPAGFHAGGGTRRVPDASDLEIVVNEFSPLFRFPKYDVFDYADLGSLPVSLEPAFRVTARRPAAKVGIRLHPSLSKVFRMDTSTGDEVYVWERNSPRPSELSQVARGGAGESIFFDYQYSGKPRAYSILVDLDDPVHSTPLASQAPGQLHVDPVLITDPPPVPVP